MEMQAADGKLIIGGQSHRCKCAHAVLRRAGHDRRRGLFTIVCERMPAQSARPRLSESPLTTRTHCRVHWQGRWIAVLMSTHLHPCGEARRAGVIRGRHRAFR
jgi:hypothetical protein